CRAHPAKEYSSTDIWTRKTRNARVSAAVSLAWQRKAFGQVSPELPCLQIRTPRPRVATRG
ncbi:MAG: hypothetical protein WCI73_07740, partial [Phycisphaerae bacterium]